MESKVSKFEYKGNGDIKEWYKGSHEFYMERNNTSENHYTDKKYVVF